jgi:hypothetical protein
MDASGQNQHDAASEERFAEGLTARSFCLLLCLHDFTLLSELAYCDCRDPYREAVGCIGPKPALGIAVSHKPTLVQFIDTALVCVWQKPDMMATGPTTSPNNVYPLIPCSSSALPVSGSGERVSLHRNRLDRDATDKRPEIDPVRWRRSRAGEAKKRRRSSCHVLPPVMSARPSLTMPRNLRASS